MDPPSIPSWFTNGVSRVIKFETKIAEPSSSGGGTNRVTSLSLHPHQPWVCASLENGVIQLWDYEAGEMLWPDGLVAEEEGHCEDVDSTKTTPLLAKGGGDTFRCVDVHPNKNTPLVVTGGDDGKVKVWDIESKKLPRRRCSMLSLLEGHSGPINSVQFRPNNTDTTELVPWIVSASEDATCRIWDFRQETCLVVFYKFRAPFTSAAFHSTEPLIVTSSADGTVMVWDYIGLVRATANGHHPGGEDHETPTGCMSYFSKLFADNHVRLKYLLEGHNGCVNSANFHPSLPLLISSGDDCQVKLWRFGETKAWEVKSLIGHSKSVLASIFHPTEDLGVSISEEDGSCRVWYLSGSKIWKILEGDNWRCLVAHKKENLFAAANDAGITVFQLK